MLTPRADDSSSRRFNTVYTPSYGYPAYGYGYVPSYGFGAGSYSGYGGFNAYGPYGGFNATGWGWGGAF